ncbi:MULTISPECIES: thioesterase II family protein [Burkholderia]|uniref:Pyochelin biosynthesis protein PchC n=1 Tax=Burkholderia mayonis TaxID=1385591 RepID=A0A1B4FKH6_9BURK|nr:MULTISPECIES: alpha/beta fold hydrolase [Burkholderia]AOJ04138.1 pyochelin biosynthesis protein PchC [Burkholderia mayonis]KVE40417.1 pyochelin biosynthesis protein PchC [Burkholderia sp. BDU5]KVE42746.1 pyochelin biosynthesis protein PchC [Burkholderia mayonis]
MRHLQTQAEGAVRFSLAGAAPVRHQLVIFPHAGGSTEFYRPWRDHLPADVELIVLQYPQLGAGTASAWDDPVAAVRRCTRGLANLLGVAPITVFGHSMGALLALHVAQALAPLRFRIEQLVLSSQMTPAALQTELRTEQDIDRLAQQALGLGEVDGLSRIGEDAQRLLVSFIRQDLALLQRLAPLPVGELPATRIFGGDEDPLVDRPKLAEWSAFLSQHLTPEVFPGGHFYLRDQVPAVVDALLRSHRSALAS